MATPIVLYGALVVVVFLLWRQIRRKDGRPPLPPGPPSDPIIGHLRVAPLKNHGEVYHEWSKQYGTL